MSVRTLVVLALAIVCGGSSAAGVFLMSGKATTEKPKTVTVVVAAREISRGEVVGEASLATREWPVDYVPDNAVTDVAEVLERTAIVGMSPGEPILSQKLAGLKDGSGLAVLVPPGHRAYTIQTSSVGSNVAGFVRPGNRVDVLLTLRGGREDKTGGGTSTTLLQAVEILATDQELDAPSADRVEKLRSVTLLVTPNQAAMLDLGHNMGTLALSLRNPGDIAEADTTPATVNFLRYAQEEPEQQQDQRPEEPHTVMKPPSLLATAATAAAKTAVVASLATNVPKQQKQKPKRQYLQTYTLRGRSSGRIMVRPSR